MRIRVLALDFDNTIAVNDRLDHEVAALLHEARGGGILRVLVTGRILSDLQPLLPSPDTILFVTHNVDEAVFLSDQILILSKRPAKIVKVVEVKLPRPRDRTGQECNEIRRDVLRELSEEMNGE